MNIKELRQITRLSQSQFAEKYHIKLDTLQNLEQSRTKVPELPLYLLEQFITEVDYKEC